ncbi:MAG: arginyltransferase, partial [Thermoanaerobaculia bacterium]
MKPEVIHEGAGDEESCHYLPGRRSRTRYRYVENCATETYTRMLERGWRRFGRVFFRPACAGCGECRSLRVDVDRFRPNRSMRRSLKRNRDLEVFLQPASMTAEHLALYDRYHADMARRKGWSERAPDPLDYRHSFVDGQQEFGHEMLFLAGDRLLGVALVDILPAAVSAVYCYYEPAERRRGLGVFSVLQHVALARSRGIPHVYLGYWIRDNPDMCYKARYRPHALLHRRPSLDEPPSWVAADE